MLEIKNKCFIPTTERDIMLEQALTISNPAISKKINLGLSLFGIPNELYYFEKVENGYYIPLGSMPTLLSHLNQKYGTEYTDHRTECTMPLELKFTGELRSYQSDIITTLSNRTVGTISAMTGSGKTVVFVALTAQKLQCTLILVHTKELANQTKKSYLKFTNIEAANIGMIGDGQFNIQPVTVGLYQSLHRLGKTKFEEVNSSFGLVIADEAHIVPAATFYNCLTKLSAKYRFGFTATPERTDGLTKAIFFAVGPIVHKVPIQELSGVLTIPEYKPIYTEYNFDLFSTKEYTYMINDLSVDEIRNKLILENVDKTKFTCILCSRISQVNLLYEKLQDVAVRLTSKTPKKERLAALGLIESGDKTIIISTWELFAMGIDIPKLEILILASPKKSKVIVTQAIGRIMRKFDKKALIIDFVDIGIDILKYAFFTRKRIITKILGELNNGSQNKS